MQQQPDQPTRISVSEVLSPEGTFYGFEITAGENLFVLFAGTDKIKHNGITPDVGEALTRNTLFSCTKRAEDLSAPASPVGNRWVKASERLPKYPGSPQNHFRIDGEHKVHGNFHYSIDDERCEGEIVFTVIGMGLFEDYVIERDKFDGLEWLEDLGYPLYSNEETVRYKNALSAIRANTLETPYSSRVIHNIANAALSNSPESKPSPVIEIGETPKPEDMPQTENPLASYWFERARLCLVDRNDFKAQLARANEKIVEMAKAFHPAPAPIVGEIPEETNNWIEAKIRERAEEFKLMIGVGETDSYAFLYGGRKLAQDMYHKMKEQNSGLIKALIIDQAKELSIYQTELAAANALIKEKQQWIDSHL